MLGTLGARTCRQLAPTLLSARQASPLFATQQVRCIIFSNVYCINNREVGCQQRKMLWGDDSCSGEGGEEESAEEEGAEEEDACERP